MYIHELDPMLKEDVEAACNLINIITRSGTRKDCPENLQYSWYCAQWEYHRLTGTLSVEFVRDFIRAAIDLYEVSVLAPFEE